MHTSEFDEIITFPVGNAKFPPDSSQQKVIKAINNTVVSAGAGSGKTEVLANRFAYLLMTDPDLHVKNILAITFTKKAAAEIYARVFKKLNDYKTTLSDPKYNGKYLGEGKPVALAERALSEFSDARIQTLDSYSNDVVKLAVARYGIKPDFSVGEPSSEISLMAKNFVLRHLENPDFQDAFKTFSQVGKLEQFAKDYFSEPILGCTSIATETGWFSKNLELQSKKIIQAWNEAMKPSDETFSPLAIKNNAAMIFENMKDEDKEKPSYKNVPKIIDVSDSIFVTIEEAISENNAEKILEEITPFIEWLEIEKPAGNSNVGKSLKLLKFDKDDLFNPYGKFSACCSFIKNYKATAQMYKMMDMFLEEVNAKKKKDGQLSFKDIGELALRVLHEQSDILKQQQSLIKKIMIDEFQDNNAKNKELLELLAGESKEKLFFVGDEKQSIYKFRGADVSVFNGLKNSLEGKDREQVLYSMNNNYRSDSELLKAFNMMFGDDGNRRPTQVPESAPDQFYDMPSLFYFENYLAVPEYEAMYLEHNFATKPDESGADKVAPIELSENNIKIHSCILNSGKNQDKETKFSDFKTTNKILNESETTAFFIAKKIKELVDGGMSFSEIAILDSSRTHRGHLQKFLTMENIPYSVDVQKNIFSEGIVNDFYNFLRICIYPNDTNAFIAFLTSPFVCMSKVGAENVMAVIFDKNEKIIIDDDGNEFEIAKNFEAFSDDFDSEIFGLSASDKEKYERAKEFYKTEKLAILSSSITKTIEHLWYDTGYFFETELTANTKIYGEQFDLLYQVAIEAENQGKNIEWFIDQLALTKQAENSFSPDEDADLETDDVHYPLERQEAVTIMTIHQSKGLEFGTVFVTGIFDNPKPDKSKATFFDEGAEDSTGVSLRAKDGSYNYFYLEHLEDSKNKSLAEQKRLIYVAITRAKNEVFLVGDLAESDDLKLQTPKTKEPYYKPNVSCSLMHKLLRYYYSVEKGLYQDNDYDDAVLEKMSGEVPAEKPYYNATTKAPFDFIKINPVSAKARAIKQKSATEQRTDLKEKLESLFNEKEKELLTPPEKELLKTATPSSLETFTPGLKEIVKTPNPDYEKLNDFFTLDDAALQNGVNDDGGATDEDAPIEETAAKSEFTRGTFGTMAHSYLEHWVKTGKFDGVENPATFDSSVEKSLNENFDETKRAALSKICALMTKNFAESTLGKKVVEAKAAGRIVKAENKFKLFQNDTLFIGTIDLFFENEDGTFTLVDYKTDEKIYPEKYYEQQKCYKSAIEKIYGRNVTKCFLYYLRFDCEIEIG